MRKPTEIIRKWIAVLVSSFCAGVAIGMGAPEVAAWLLVIVVGALLCTFLVDYLYVHQAKKQQEDDLHQEVLKKLQEVTGGNL
jgi:uncharacterized membrane protein (DUF485 family)